MKLKDIDSNYYLPGFFSIHMMNSKSLSNMLGSEDEHCLFHEYLHFIQDITTTYGLMNCSVIYNQIKDLYALAKKKKEENIFKLEIPIKEYVTEATRINRKLVNAYLYPEETILDSSEIGDVIPSFEEGIRSDSTRYDVIQYKVYFGEQRCAFVQFGAQAIYEGICHTLEKTVYNLTTDELKAPYDLSKLIWDFYLPNEKNNLKAFIDLSEFSLMFFNPAEIFIATLEKIQNKKIELNENFYEDLCSTWKEENEDKSYYDIFMEQYQTCVNDVKGFMKADIYKDFKDWILRSLDIGSLFRETKKPLFSELLKFKDATPEEKTLWMKIQFFQNIGYPPVFNADGEIWFHEADTTEKANSVFVSQAIYNVADCLLNGKCECLLRESCLILNENNENFEIDDNCINSPWKREITDDYFCPFMAVLKTWGLLDINIIKTI